AAQAQTHGADSVEKDVDGQPYFRLNLLKKGPEGQRKPDFGSGSRREYAYKDAFEAYSEEVQPGNDIVSSVTYTIAINQNQFETADNLYTDGSWEAGEGGATAAVPDFGTWYGSSQTNETAWVNNMAFEVTGRFYRESGRDEVPGAKEIAA